MPAFDEIWEKGRKLCTVYEKNTSKTCWVYENRFYVISFLKGKFEVTPVSASYVVGMKIEILQGK